MSMKLKSTELSSNSSTVDNCARGAEDVYGAPRSNLAQVSFFLRKRGKS